MEATKSILEGNTFEVTARNIFDSLRKLTGAASGYVALLSPDGSENDVLFLESGGLPCSVDPALIMPIRGLRGNVYRTGIGTPPTGWSEETVERHALEDLVKYVSWLLTEERPKPLLNQGRQKDSKRWTGRCWR